MEVKQYLVWSLGVCLAAVVLDSTAGQLEYVPGEVLIVPDADFRSTEVRALGMSVTGVHTGRTRFSTVKVKPGQTVEAAVQALANTPGIKYAEPNYIYHATAVPDDPAFPEYWGLRNTGQTVNSTAGTSGVDIGAVAAWDTVTDCSSLIVAVIDSGVDYNHPDLASVIWNNLGEVAGNATDDDGNGFVDDTRGWDFIQGDNDPMDFQYHGTHVAGTIGAVGNNGIGGVGVCWKATLMPLRALGSTGSGPSSGIVAAVDYAVANGAKIINLSLGGASYSALFNDAIANANAAGVLVVAAAGNDAEDTDTTPHYPSSYDQPNIISVAATDQNDELASFSSYGATSVDVAAPGVNVLSTRPPARTGVSGCSWGFEDGTKQGWTSSTYDTGSDAIISDTVDVTDAKSNSGSYSITDSPAADYANDRIYTATSPACDLTGEEGAVLEFAFNLDTESDFDWFDWLASGDGSAWTSLLDGGVSGNTNNKWYVANLDLRPWDGVATTQVRWTLTSDFSSVYDGVYIDDVKVTVPGTVHTGREYTYLNGTSMATPHVSGAAALIWANEPTLTVSEVRSRILDNGDPVSALSAKTVSGRRINLLMALPLMTPSGLTATAASSTQVELSWTDNSVSEVSYQVQRSNGGGYATIASLAADAQSYNDTSVSAETAYTYRVLAAGRDGRLSASSAVSVTTPAVPAPGGGGSGGGGGGGGAGGGGSGGGGAVDGFLLLALLVLVLRRQGESGRTYRRLV